MTSGRPAAPPGRVGGWRGGTTWRARTPAGVPGIPSLRGRAWRLLAAVLASGTAVAGCSVPGLSPEAERGRQVYLAYCTACHATDPARDGPLGPAVRGASRDLLEARLLRGDYPPGYQPKRPSRVMQAMPQLAGSLDDLAAYLR
ncbi:MAG: cytochrome c [Armatimonadota bacterium]|nr:cytochrome c [Armatimonadota bacterium]MDR7528737.1 cytochrome c [Armatimonadota bacterium]